MSAAPFRASVTAALLAVAGLAAPLVAQSWSTMFGSVPLGSPGYVEVTHHPDLNPVHAFTFEAWYIETDAIPPDEADCRSIAGKNWVRSWWVGVCTVGGARVLRSYLTGDTDNWMDAGKLPPFGDWWTHVAVTFDGSKHRHFINGELVGERAESGPLAASTDPLRIFSDVRWAYTPVGYVREVRLWRVARTLSQLRAAMFRSLTSPQSGLVAVWPLAGDAMATVGPHHGRVAGTGRFYTYLPNPACFHNDHILCLADRFQVRVRWQHPGGSGEGKVVPGFSSDSGLFWFFSAPNWELLVKTVDGCGLNHRRWIFYAPVTDTHYEIDVFDRIAAKKRVFIGYQGATQGATDTDAFDTCP